MLHLASTAGGERCDGYAERSVARAEPLPGDGRRLPTRCDGPLRSIVRYFREAICARASIKRNTIVGPDGWGTRKDAKNAFEREVGLIPLIVSVYKRMRPTSVWSYQRTGAGKRPATALVDETSHADPAAAIAAKLGRVRWVKRVEPR